MTSPTAALSDDARDRLVGYDWPGNVRALRHAAERAVILAEGDDLRGGRFPDAARAANGSRRAPPRAPI